MSEEIKDEFLEETTEEPTGAEETTPAQEGFNDANWLEEAMRGLDVTREARGDAMENVKSVLDRASSGAKIDRKDVTRALRGLYLTSGMLDDLVKVILEGLLTTIRALSVSETNIMQQGIQLTTLVRALQTHGLITEAQLQEVYKTEVMPELKRNMPRTPIQEAAGNDLTTNAEYQVPTAPDSE